jgi:hypothetical protein
MASPKHDDEKLTNATKGIGIGIAIIRGTWDVVEDIVTVE